MSGEGTSTLAVLSMDTGQWRQLAPGSQAQYLSSGYLLYHAPYIREGQLNAVRFDAAKAEFLGSPVTVVEGVFRAAAGGAAFFAADRTGTLVFAPGGFGRRLVQVDHRGRRTPVSADRLGFRFPRYSPDGRRIAVAIDPRPSQIWVYDIERGTKTPLATDTSSITPMWTPDGRHVAFSCCGGIWWRPADGSRAAERLFATEFGSNPTWWSPDGRLLLFQEAFPATQYDLLVATIGGGEPRRLVSSAARDIGGRVSPDGRWLAYYSNESGRNEVYLRPFPKTDDQRWIVSTTGGQSPVWSPDGRELFYMSGSAMLTVPVSSSGAGILVGTPQVLFEGPFDTTQDINVDISPDGAHFAMVEADPNANPVRLNVILNWAEELKKRVP
jgi:serine/threonine-protein kinase